MDDFQRHAVQIFKALADPTRYEIVKLLVERGEMGCGDFDEAFPHSKSAMSHHYRILENAQLIKTRKVGQHVRITAQHATLKRFLPGFKNAHIKAVAKQKT